MAKQRSSRRDSSAYARPPSAADIARSDERWRDQNARQTSRITALLGFLQHKGLVDEFNAYEEGLRDASGANSG